MKISRNFDTWSVCLKISGVPDAEGRKGGTGYMVRTFRPDKLIVTYYRNPYSGWILREVRITGP